MSIRTKFAATTAVATGALVGVLAVPAPASAAAATKCTNTQHKEVDTVGPDLDMYIELCVSRDASNRYRARAMVKWSDGGGGACCGMEKVLVEVRLERRDALQRRTTGNLQASMSGFSSGTIPVETSTYTSSSAGGWTADGKVTYNIQSDGAGDKTWDLGGSPSI
ncbi:hypothetical protein CGZ69_06665 [Streptomyces peucetius subsp. caesius ATCC 27952]|nr:hypothetical protein CGZ69_06665 [Streptomyces peucetius subsp. caesius ATCC 27952]